jgi:hypothetical protein
MLRTASKLAEVLGREVRDAIAGAATSA